MRGLALAAMRGPLAASLIVAACALLALVFTPALFVSGGLLSLVTLRQGALEGLRVAVIAGAMTAGAMLFVNGRLGAAALAIFAVWLPVWGASQTLRRTSSEGAAFTNIGFCVAGYAALMRFANPDVDAFWRARLAQFGAVIKAQGGQFLNDHDLETVGGLMHEASVAVLLISLVCMVVLGRWWQAGLYHPGGFRSEFQVLRMPRWVSPLGAAVAVAGLVAAAQGHGDSLASDLLIVLALLFAFQGLAVIHHRREARALSRHWLIGLYVMLGFVPHIVITVLAVTGIADMAANFRGLVLVNGRHDGGK